MKKRILFLLLAFTVLCGLLSMGDVTVYAYSETDIAYPVAGGNIYFDRDTGTITDCDKSVTAADIPSEIDGVTVTKIGDEAFKQCYSLKSAVIPDSVTSVSKGAFSGCRNLKKLTLPSVYGSCFGDIFGASSYEYNRINVPVSLKEVVLTSATSIGDYSFCGCNGLTSITIPEGVTMIGDNAFSGCTGLQSIMIPKSVTSIDWGAFYDCNGLTSITIPESVTSIGVFAFQNCTSLKSITIPESVTSIGSHAFYGCTSLKNITIPKGVTSIGESAFDGCTDLTGIWVDAKNPYYSNDVSGVLFNKSKTELICAPGKINGNCTIPESVTSIGGYAFQNCTGLTSISIPESVTSIGENAFSDCNALTSITIPKGVTSIGERAFDGCTDLTGIWVDAKNPYYSNDASGVLFNKSKTEVICAPKKINGNYTIPESVTSIGLGAFYGCTGLTSITISESVKSIGDDVFAGCTSLESITIPESVTSIGLGAFYGCTSLKNITIPESVTSIGDDVFAGCNSLKNITIPESVTSIGWGAFYGCTGLTSISIPKGVTSIGGSAFRNCTGLTSISIPKGVTSIGENAFSDCTALTSITIPESVTRIYFWAFSGCTGLTDITIPESVTRIDWGAFYGCTGLTGITIPKSVTNISDYAFSCCSALKGIWVDANNPYYSNDASGVLFNKSKTELICAPGKISGNYTIPESVTRIGWGAFYGCTGLTSITIPESVTSISNYVFPGCSALKGIWVDANNPYYSNDAAGVLFNKSKTELICAPGRIIGKYTIPEGVTCIGEYAFSGCTGLTDITIPESVKSIGEGAFHGCTGLTSVTIPDGVTTIGEEIRYEGLVMWGGYQPFHRGDSCTGGAFSDCTGLTSITIPESVTSIDDYTFIGCKNLSAVCFAGNSPTIGLDVFTLFDNQTQPKFSIPGESICYIIPGLSIYYIVGREGWTSPTWNGYPTATWDGVNIPHIHSYQVVVTAPTCTEKGFTTHTCECGDSYIDTYIDALGHDFGDWAQMKAPTCTEKGEEKRTCSRCEVPEAREIPALGHEYENGVCVRCGEKAPNAQKPVEFADVPKNAWYVGAVEYAVQNGLMNGVGGDQFNPEGSMTRAMLVTVLWRFEGEPEAGKNTFSDVPNGQWYTDAVAWAAANGVVNGVGNNRFDPEGKITREQMATILYRYAEKKGIDTGKRAELGAFPDAKQVSAYAKDPVQWAVAEKIINGSDGKLLPQGDATRAQVATILMRFIENIVKK